MKQLMMIGFGAMAAEVYAHMPQDLQLKWIVVPVRSVEKVQAQVSSEVQVISSIDECQGTPDYVIEVAGQAAVKEHAQKVLEKGWTIGLISVGTLADNEFLIQLKNTAEQHDAHYIFWQVRLLELMESQRRKKVVWKRSLIRAAKVQKVGVVAMQSNWLI
jgi:aspartate dehydrogenase